MHSTGHIYPGGDVPGLWQAEDASESVKAKDKYKRFLRMGILLVCFLGLAVALDKSLQRQLQQLLVELGLINEQV